MSLYAFNKPNGNGKKKYAYISVNGTLVGRVIYYYWSENDDIIRLLDELEHVTAQFYKNTCKVILEEEKEEESVKKIGE